MKPMIIKKLMVLQLVKKYNAFFKSQGVSTVFTRVSQLELVCIVESEAMHLRLNFLWIKAVGALIIHTLFLSCKEVCSRSSHPL
jgi:hypothetical protein